MPESKGRACVPALPATVIAHTVRKAEQQDPVPERILDCSERLQTTGNPETMV